MNRRRFWPVDPVRWVHARRGKTYVVQHILAETPPFEPLYPKLIPPHILDQQRVWHESLVHTLCGTTIGRDVGGPVKKRPLVTARPADSVPPCRRCLRVLEQITCGRCRERRTS